MQKVKPTVSPDVWLKRIQAARTKREKQEQNWKLYARLFSNAYTAVAQANDDKLINLPNGDQVKAGLIFRNIEQTRALLEVPEITVSASVKDSTRELGREDTHRESVVSQALTDSMNSSGLIKDEEESDDLKWDGIVIGHAINYSNWHYEQIEEDGPAVAVMIENEAGDFEPALDEKTGEQIFEPEKIKRVLFNGLRDMRVSPLQFLFSANAKKIAKASWHGMEETVELETLKRDPRYVIPAWVEPGAYQLNDLYDSEKPEEEFGEGLVRLVVIYEKINRELIVFLETAGETIKGERGRPRKPKKELIPIRVDRFPVIFDRPEDSPFNVFIPIPSPDNPFGISQIEHIRNPAVEVDKLKTRLTNLTRQLKRIFIYDEGKNPGLSDGAIDKIYENPDFAFLGIKNPNELDDLKKLFTEMPLPRIHPEMFSEIREAEETVRQNTGVSEIPFGGADTATESDNMMAIGGARAKRKRRRYISFLTNIARIHKSFLARFAPEGQSINAPGSDGVLLTMTFGRDAFQGRFDIEVQPGGDGMHISAVEQKMLMEATANFQGKYGPKFELVWLRQLLTKFNIRDINALMTAAQEGLLGGYLGAPGMGGQPQQGSVNLNDYTNGQAMRAAINAPNEG